MILQKIEEAGLIRPPKWLSDNTQFLCMMGSAAYGVANVESDIDVYGWAVPPKEILFPHLAGHVEGFGKQKQNFDQWQQHHIEFKDKEYDFSVYNIAKFFQLCMDNNPNMIDSLFVPTRCIIHSTQIGAHVRENRRLFLHKGCYHKLKGYAYAQLHKMKSKNREGKRVELIEKHGFDTKFAYHIVRLLSQCEQILTEHDLVLDERTRREHMKAVRRGEVKEEQIVQWFEEKEKTLEKMYRESTLQNTPDEAKIKELLMNCLEMHYGNLAEVVVREDRYEKAVRQVQEIVRNL